MAINVKMTPTQWFNKKGNIIPFNEVIRATSILMHYRGVMVVITLLHKSNKRESLIVQSTISSKSISE